MDEKEGLIEVEKYYLYTFGPGARATAANIGA